MFASFMWQPLVALGDNSTDSYSDSPRNSARLFSKLTEKVGLNPNADWTDSFGVSEPDEVGQNLYLLIYKKVNVQPEEDAYENTAGRYAVTKGDLNLIASGDYTPILEEKSTLTQEELRNKVSEINDRLEEEQELLQVEADIKSTVEATEMFANGDLQDSGFDLINDLRLIEEILFLKTDPIDIGGSYLDAGGRRTGASPSLANIGQTNESDQAVTPPPETTVGPTVGTSVQPFSNTAGLNTGSTTGSTGAPSSQSAPDAGGGTDQDLNPNTCFADNDLSNALSKFTQNASTNPDLKDLSNSNNNTLDTGGNVNTNTPDGPDNSIVSPASNNNANQNPGADFLPAAVDEDINPQGTPPATRDTWLKPDVCNNVFCLTVEIISEPVTSQYQNSDNCIACHAEKINEVLDLVISHSLAPSKATGNLAEPAICKKAIAQVFSNVSLNVHTMSVPVETPQNDDLVFRTSTLEDFKQNCYAREFFPFDKCDDPSEDTETREYVPAPILEDRAAKQAINSVADGETIAEVQKRISNVIDSYTIEQQGRIELLEQENEGDLGILSFSPLNTEMLKMNGYFINIRDIIKSLHVPVDTIPGKQACEEFKNKRTCE